MFKFTKSHHITNFKRLLYDEKTKKWYPQRLFKFIWLVPLPIWRFYYKNYHNFINGSYVTFYSFISKKQGLKFLKDENKI